MRRASFRRGTVRAAPQCPSPAATCRFDTTFGQPPDTRLDELRRLALDDVRENFEIQRSWISCYGTGLRKCSLRRKIETDPARPQLIVTERSAGYILVPAVESPY